MLRNIQDSRDEMTINMELGYLLHVRRKGQEFKRDPSQTLDRQLKELMLSYHAVDYNPRVLVVLIETGHCQRMLTATNKTDYPKFLITILGESNRNFVKESVCRMIIKSFGKRKSKESMDSGGSALSIAGLDGSDEKGKLEFSTLVEPLIKIMTRPQDNGVKLTSLSIMALVNMCNQSEEIKDVFLQKHGFQIIMQLLNSKDEDVLVNMLKLVMNLIAKNRSETSSQIGRTLAEEENIEYGANAILKRLIKLVKRGPDIPHCSFSKAVTFMAVGLLRAFIQHSSATKALMMTDKATPGGENFLEAVINKLHPDNIGQIDQEIEGAILSLLTQVVSEEIEHTGTVGEHFIKDAGARLEALLDYMRFKAKQEYGVGRSRLKKKDLDELLKQKRISANVVFTERNEVKFFKFIALLVKTSDENRGRLKPVLGYVREYREAVVESSLDKYTRQLESGDRQAAHFVRHYQELNKKLKSLEQMCTNS